MKVKLIYQRGYLLISALVLIVVVAFLAVVVTNLAVTEAHSTVDQLNSAKAFYIAQAGLQRASYAFMNESVTCANITGHANLTNISFGDGNFTVTGTTYNPTSTTLSANIGDAATIIPLASLSGYAPYGRVTIDAEAIDYAGTSLAAGDCSGFAPCLTGLMRGASGTTTAAHNMGAAVAQHQCHIESSGGVPNLTNPDAKRTVSEEIYITNDNGWLIGDKDPSGEIIANWNGTTWTRYGPTAVPDVNYYALAVESDTAAWAVGESGVIIYWGGSNWQQVASGTGEDLYGISCVSGQCWAVGDGKTFLRWNGLAWSAASVAAGFPNKDIKAVYCNATDDCWAACNKNGSNALIAHWDGSQWSDYDTGTADNVDYYGVTCITSEDCWLVGKNGSFAHWDGSSWSAGSVDSGMPNTNFNDVDCAGVTGCWAAGEQSGGTAVFAQLVAGTWMPISIASIPNQKYYGVSCSDTEGVCWATGQNGALAFWDGTNWSTVTPVVPAPYRHMRDIVYEAGVTPVLGMWREVFD